VPIKLPIEKGKHLWRNWVIFGRHNLGNAEKGGIRSLQAERSKCHWGCKHPTTEKAIAKKKATGCSVKGERREP